MSTPTTAHWAPKVPEISRTSSGLATAAELTLTLSAPSRSKRRGVLQGADPAAHRERDEHLLGGARDDVDHGLARIR